MSDQAKMGLTWASSQQQARNAAQIQNEREWVDVTYEDFLEYCKTLHPLWNTHMSRTEAEAFFRAGAAKLREKNT